MRIGTFTVVTILLLITLNGCACPFTIFQPSPLPTPSPQPPVSEPEYADKLAKRFCPIIYLKGEGDIVESYEPAQIEVLVEQADVHDIGNPSFSEKATLPGLSQWVESIYFLDIIGLGPNTKSSEEYRLNYEKAKVGYQPTVYTRVIERIDLGYTIIQYWIFYYCNDWRNFHEGDWEIVQLNFPGNTVRELFETGEEPILAAYSQHQAGQKMSWIKMKDAGIVEETHPIVYVAKGSHANYFAPGMFWSGLDFDDTGLSSWQVITPDKLKKTLLSEIGIEEKGTEWLEFKGYWGEYIDFSISILDLKFYQHGPFGPPWNDGGNVNKRWGYPYEWATQLPEYPKPFWTIFLNIPDDWSRLAVFSLFSPADLHIYDSMGRHVGLDEQGKLDQEIPGAIYITPAGTDYKTILIPGADVANEYQMIVKGIESGTMDIRAQVPDVQARLNRFLEYINVPLSPTTIARSIIKPEFLAPMRVPSIADTRGGTTRDRATKLEIDNDGDGVFEIESAPGKYIRQEVVPVLPPKK